MPAHPLISRPIDAVKATLLQIFDTVIDPLLIGAQDGAIGPAEAETGAWQAVLALGQQLLGGALGLLCRHKTETALAARGKTVDDVWLRMDDRGWGRQTTTFGEVRFPFFAYREARGGVTKTPSRTLFPRYEHCRSSRLCLEWEAALGSEHPFRLAEKALTFFTHGAVGLEDTTIERHAVQVGLAVSRRWLYQPRAEIVQILREKATRDAKTGLPLVYASTDAHMLTRYVDDSWNAEWKAINGIRVWCVDAKTKEIVHLGGEYTWGDCEEVVRLFEDLRRTGVLPRDGDYGGIHAQLALVTDGARWIEERVYPLFPEAIKILDAYHVVERLGKVAGDVHGVGSVAGRRLQAIACEALGLRSKTASSPKVRRGHRKGIPRPPAPVDMQGSVDQLFAALADLPLNVRRHRAVADFVAFLDDNAYRMDYAGCRSRGIQIGSGAMESMHRFGSQLRLKRSGCRWLPETAIGILNLRLLAAVGRWEEYWIQPDLDHQLAARMAA